jgi:integrase/recombinase XerD
MTPLRHRMIEDLEIRNYSPGTIENYVRYVAGFSRHFWRSPERLGPEELRTYQLYLIKTKRVSWSYFNCIVCALRFLYVVTLGQPDMVQRLPYAKKPKKLPTVLSLDEVRRFLGAIGNAKHRMVLITAYAGGLRISETLRLQATDIDSQRTVLHIHLGKGRKDRMVPLSDKLLMLLRAYYAEQRPGTYLFPGQTDRPLSPKSIQEACKRARKAAGLRKRVTAHTMRHSYATHMLEAGTDLRTLQVILGHSSISSTAIYLHVRRHRLAAARSPLDLIDLES